MYITLKEAKKHLIIDDDFREDDDYITFLIQVSEDAVANHLNVAFKDLLVEGMLPPAVVQAVLLLVGNLYNNREPISYGSVTKIPYTLDYLLGLYKNYTLP